MRKKKHAKRLGVTGFFAARLLAGFMAAVSCAVLSASLTLAFPATAEAQEEKRLGTRNSGTEVITRNPDTGAHVMQTPETAPQTEYPGPRTIIVSPEVYPGAYPGGQPDSAQSRSPNRSESRQ